MNLVSLDKLRKPVGCNQRSMEEFREWLAPKTDNPLKYPKIVDLVALLFRISVPFVLS